MLCYVEQPTALKGSFQVSKNCILTEHSQIVGNFTLDLVLSNNLTELNRFIELTIKEKSKPLTAVLLGKRAVVHTLSENLNVDLTALCHAVSLPERDELKCKSFDLPDDLFLVNCSVSGINVEETYNFTVNFFNDSVNKTCEVQLLSMNVSTLINNLTEKSQVINKQIGLSNETNAMGYYARYKTR